MIMFEIDDVLRTIRNIEKNDFEKYIESIYPDFYDYLYGLDIAGLKSIRDELEDILYDMIENGLISDENTAIANALLLLLAEQFEQLHLTGAIIEILPFLQASSIKFRLEASILYLKINDLTTEYHSRFDNIVALIVKSDEEEEFRYKTISAIANYYLHGMKQFFRIKNANLVNSFRVLFTSNQEKYPILRDPLLADILELVSIESGQQSIDEAQKLLDGNKIKSLLRCKLEVKGPIEIEKSDYSQKLYAMENPTFEKIRQISYDYINRIPHQELLYNRLDRGRVIIEDEELLYQYMFSYSAMHIAKLYESFAVVLDKLNGSKVNVIDWGCGQALASSALMAYLKENRLNISIDNITLIEPSRLALSRGMLHLDVLKEKHCTTSAINKDLDCIEQSDLVFENENIVLHLFSNILDAEFFRLDKVFLGKISQNIQSTNYFICVSPNINAKRNGRLDIFYKYFDDNFNTELISARETDIGRYRRYEKVFEVKYTTQMEIVDTREEIAKESREYHINIYKKLFKYNSIIKPILNVEKIRENIESDPDYVIFKIRKVVEVITSKIYIDNGGKNENRISQNDKIRYLSFEKKVLSKKAQSHLHTIRTIGNVSVHEDIANTSKILKEDAYFIVTALILLIEELQANKII